MSTIEGDKAPELVPASLQLAPFFQVFVFLSRFVKELLGSHIAVFHTETSLIHAPERQATDRIVHARSHLSPHVLPPCGDITAPSGRTETLFPGKSASGEQEYAPVGIHRSLPVIDGIGIHDGVGVEIFGARAECRRAGEFFAIPHRCAVAHVGFAGIHPPGINAIFIFRVEILIHLPPKHLARTGIVGIVKRAHVAQPVVDGVSHGLMIHPSVGIEFLVVFHRTVEFGPYGNHEAPVHGMDTVEHGLRIGVARGLKRVVAPRIELPVIPVLHDVVHRNATLTEFAQGRFYFLTARIAFPALPEAERPLRENLCLAGQCAVARNYSVYTFTDNEVVVHVLAHFAPDAQFALFLLALWDGSPQSAIAHVAIGIPVDEDFSLDTSLQRGRELIAVGIPSCAPTLRHHFFAIDIHFHVTGIIEDEPIKVINGSFEIAFVSHV